MAKSVVKMGSTPKAALRKKKAKGKDSGTSSDEEEMLLAAIESGRLEEIYDELKTIKHKDPKLMTARQRAMFERKTVKEPGAGGEQLFALPSGCKEKAVTPEALQKSALKSLKRKQLADEKREKNMKKTMDKLLKKQESKSRRNSKYHSFRTQVPRVTYRISAVGMSISLPSGVDFPLRPQQGLENVVQNTVLCSVGSCCKAKKYKCSRTGVPVCSLACYHKNIMVFNQDLLSIDFAGDSPRNACTAFPCYQHVDSSSVAQPNVCRMGYSS